MVVRLAFRAAAVAAIVWVGREAMRRWVNGPEQPTVAGSWEGWEPGTPPATTTAARRAAPAERPNKPATAAGTAAATTTTAAAAAAATRTHPRAGTSTKKAGPAKKAPAAVKAPPRGTGEASSNGSWVGPDASGEPPATHPVKAKLSSRLYRVPGMPMYDRSVPDRCYESPEAAEADGFTRAAR